VADKRAPGSYGSAGSVELYTEIVGAGPDLVLLHGGASSIPDLDELRAALTGVRRVIAPDQRGHGRTSDPGELSYELMASDTAALLDALGVSEADVVGWSDGGIVGLTLAATRPDLVRRLVPISANVADEGAPPPVAPGDSEWLAHATGAELPAPPPDPDLPSRAETWPATADRILDMWRSGPALTLAGLGAIEVPVLFLSGDHDMITLEHTLAMFRAVPGAQLAIVPGADHYLPRTHVESVARLIREFLEPITD
jgi:pimeloyl-ACP methyl ester carboxylesterase